ncbi:MAG TPA: hypothetical protein PK156_35850 [Polyangium sp.]|nr:hypothetical protein [Polyangium sp.]
MRTRSKSDSRDGRGFLHQQKNRAWRRWIALAIAIVALGASGCSASLGFRPTVAGYAVAPVDTVPVAIDGYPHYPYRGRYAYLVDGQWYYPTPDGWVVFLEEPRPLLDYRHQVQSAPPANRPPDVYYGYPPPQQPTPPRELNREYRPQ